MDQQPSDLSLAATTLDEEQATAAPYSGSSERTPLLQTPSIASAPATTTPISDPISGDLPRSRSGRTVTFNPNPVTKTISPDPEPFPHRPRTTHFSPGPYSTGSAANSAVPGGGGVSGGLLRSHLRRRNSHGSIPTAPPAAAAGPLPKIGPQRSSKNAQKLKYLPYPEFGEDGPDEESGRDVYSQYTRIKDPTARRDAARLGKADRFRLPRVTAYCTANRYHAENLMRFLKGRAKTKGANPKLIDECIYTPYTYESQASRERRLEVRYDSGFASQQTTTTDPVQAYERRHSTGSDVESAVRREELIQMDREGGGHHQDEFGNGYSAAEEHLAGEGEEHDESAVVDNAPDFDINVHMPEVFLFDYGVVVIWGMSIDQERRFLKEIKKFELESLPEDQVETEAFNFYYTREYQPRIYNDFITLKDKYNYMTKLAISHALAQSVKTSLFEESTATTIDTCKEIPDEMILTGKISLSRKQINMQIGELFNLRISIHLNGSVLDTPELFWVEPQLEPVYQAVRSYLEIDQRVQVLQDRLEVIGDLLAVLKEQLSHGHGEFLEWIVVVLIAAEICVAFINIIVDMYMV